LASLPTYEVFALRYAENPHARRSQNFIGGDDHDQPMPLDYYMWVIRSASEAILVDTGFDAEAATQRRRTLFATPAELLADIELVPDAIQDVIITHMHYDHAGNRDLFAQARFHVQDREMAYATGRCMCHAGLRHAYDGRDVAAMVGRLYEGRLCFHDGISHLRPGISLHRVGGHTDGLQVVRVWTRRGWLVLASDASHFYANMEQGRSFPIVHNVADMYEGHRLCYSLADGAANVIPGHDPLVTRRYPAAAPHLACRVIRLDADPL
jgi:glyoxylase-like metal-dependent hydrolase (beta-lactamase superfamily II)